MSIIFSIMEYDQSVFIQDETIYSKHDVYAMYIEHDILSVVHKLWW